MHEVKHHYGLKEHTKFICGLSQTMQNLHIASQITTIEKYITVECAIRNCLQSTDSGKFEWICYRKKKSIKFTHVQVTNAQRESRGIALLFLLPRR
jgi:hypothetical protein